MLTLMTSLVVRLDESFCAPQFPTLRMRQSREHLQGSRNGSQEDRALENVNNTHYERMLHPESFKV